VQSLLLLEATLLDYADGTGTNAMFFHLTGVAVDSSGNVFVGDFSNHRIRKSNTLWCSHYTCWKWLCRISLMEQEQMQCLISLWVSLLIL
jgi:hypothetical protein